MRIFSFLLGRKKQIAPTSRSSVHPASNGQDVFCVNKAKIKELLGVVTPQECQEVDELLNVTSHQVDPSFFADDYDYHDDGSIDEGFDPQFPASHVELPMQKIVHPRHKSLSTKPGEDHTTQNPSLIEVTMKAESVKINQVSENHVTQKPCAAVDVNVKGGPVQQSVRKGRPAKLTCINDKPEALSSRYWLGNRSERTNAPHPSRIREKKNVSCVISFPLPSPLIEKHYLPTPQPRTPEELFSVAHPLPQPLPPVRTSTQGQPNTPPSTPRPPAAPLHQTPESTLPMTPRKQPQRKPPNTAPIKPSLQLNSQMLVNIMKNVHPPSPSNRQSPGLTAPSYRHSPTHVPSQHTQFTYSPPCSPLQRSVCPKKWTKGALLGQGSFGTVHEGWNLEDGSFFAVKVSSRENTSPEIQQEVDVLSKLEHPNIVRYLGSAIEDSRLCIFLELVGMGSLESILRRYKRFEDYTIRSYTRQILLGLEYLHAKKTIHRDIKCGNILVDVNGQVKLSDFGIAKQVGEFMASSLKGTPLYMAPEVLMVLMSNVKNSSSYSFPADIWSLGCTVFELADGKPPWHGLEGFAFFFKVKNRELPPMPEHLSPEGKDFIRSCLRFDPEDRPTASELLEHPFVSNVATAERFYPLSPPSPLSPKQWPPATWACGHCYPSSPSQATCFDRVLGGSQRAQTLIHGR